MLKLGYKASAEQFAPTKLLDFSVYAEECGFESVFVSDHFQPWKHTDGHAPFSLTWLGALGARTKRVVMGTSVLTPTFRYHPSIVAHAFGTLGAMFENRVILGIGTGEGLNEVPSTGQPWPDIPQSLLDIWSEVGERDVPPDACLVNVYGPTARMSLHQDRDEADFQFPVVSVSLGDTGVFRLGGTDRKDPTRSFRLASGDVCVLRGPARLAHHGIDRILPGSSRMWPGGGRLNLTLRRARPGP